MNFFDPSTLPAALSIPRRNVARSFSKVYQDLFEPEFTDNPCDEMSDDEIVAYKGKVLLFDTECYQNYWCCVFKQPDTNKIISFQLGDVDEGPIDSLDIRKLAWVAANFCIIGYNSTNYDLIMMQFAMLGKGLRELYALSCQIIYASEQNIIWKLRKKYKLNEPKWNHIDLIEVAPLKGSLKLYAGRLHCKRMQDLPFDPQAFLSFEDIEVVFKYCVNDLFSTELLFGELKPALELRYKMSDMYNVDVRSRSDAQIAERVIISELQKRTGTKPERPDIPPGTIYMYRVPDYIRYTHPALQSMLEVVRKAYFRVGEDGYVQMPDEIGALSLNVGNCIYRMGIGGLHSTEKCMSHVADADTMLIDRDVASYYPAIILNQSLYPQHLGKAFLDVYRKIVDDRLRAKKEKNTAVAASLKITINGSFGKLGSKWSVLYAPDLMIQVTVTGQLSLLMLIDMLESNGIQVISGNTDGVIFKCRKDQQSLLDYVVYTWESATGFTTEETRYKAIYSRDVNNYVAVKEDGKSKVKGTYAERGSAGDSVLSKNPENLICNDAVIKHLESGVPVEDTIRNCKDIRRFVTIRNVIGGARKSDVRLGKVIRWYYSTEMLGEINSLKNGNKVPNSDRARPLMELPAEMPTDIDYDRYIGVANGMLIALGYKVQAVDSGFAFRL